MIRSTVPKSEKVCRTERSTGQRLRTPAPVGGATPHLPESVQGDGVRRVLHHHLQHRAGRHLTRIHIRGLQSRLEHHLGPLREQKQGVSVRARGTPATGTLYLRLRDVIGKLMYVHNVGRRVAFDLLTVAAMGCENERNQSRSSGERAEEGAASALNLPDRSRPHPLSTQAQRSVTLTDNRQLHMCTCDLLQLLRLQPPGGSRTPPSAAVTLDGCAPTGFGTLSLRLGLALWVHRTLENKQMLF